MTLPRVQVLALGGTIASIPGPDSGVSPGLTAADLLASVPVLGTLAEMGTCNLANIPSTEIDLPLLFDLLDAIRAHDTDGVAGVVVVQGTDTVEETSYVFDLLYGGDMPVVVTGAMRNPTLPGPDGPGNLYAAIACAADSSFRGQGVLVAFGDVIHAAAWLQKRDTSATGAFWSPAPLGWMAEGRPVLRTPASRRSAINLQGGTFPFVPILKPGLGNEPRLLCPPPSMPARRPSCWIWPEAAMRRPRGFRPSRRPRTVFRSSLPAAPGAAGCCRAPIGRRVLKSTCCGGALSAPAIWMRSRRA